MKKFYVILIFIFSFLYSKSQPNASFDEILLKPGTFWNGSDGKGGFKSGNFWFPNKYTSSWGSWSGFSLSNMKDTVTGSWSNQYSAITGKGIKSTGNYAVVYVSDVLKIEFSDPMLLSGFYVTNSTYTAQTMKYGDNFSKRFGGKDGKDPDFFKLIITGFDISGRESVSEEFYLADFRNDDSAKDFIVKTWKWVDLEKLGIVSGLQFRLESSDTGEWGMNTPAYFCIDEFNGLDPNNLNALTEAGFEDFNLNNKMFFNGSDGAKAIKSGGFIFKNSYNSDWQSWGGFAVSTITDNKTKGWNNQYSAIPGSGALGSVAYGVSYVDVKSEIEFQETMVSGFYITNSTYAYYSMKDGDSFSKKFGGITGNDPDWFKITISGFDKNGKLTGNKDFFLADFRSAKKEDDYILSDWKWVDLSELGRITKITFSLSSSDVGTWGMNTPSYFCIDQVNHQDLPPFIKNPVATVTENNILNGSFIIPLEPIFADLDNSVSDMKYNIESNNNGSLVSAKIVYLKDNENTLKPWLSCEIEPKRTGISNLIISVTSNHKKAFHTISIIASVPVGNKEFVSSDFKLYPNPFRDYVNLSVPLKTNSITLVSSSGQIVFSKEIHEENQIQLSGLNSLASGIYILNIKTVEGVKSFKIFKQ